MSTVDFATDHYARVHAAATKVFEAQAQGVGGVVDTWARQQLDYALRDARNAGTGINMGAIKNLVDQSIAEGKPELFRSYLEHRGNVPVPVAPIAESLALSPQMEHYVEHQPSLTAIEPRADQLAREAIQAMPPEDLAALKAKPGLLPEGITPSVAAAETPVARKSEVTQAREGIRKLTARVQGLGDPIHGGPVTQIHGAPLEAEAVRLTMTPPTIHIPGLAANSSAWPRVSTPLASEIVKAVPSASTALVPIEAIKHHDVLGGPLRRVVAEEVVEASPRIGLGERLRSGVSYVGNLFKRTPAAVAEPVVEAVSPVIHLSGPLHTMASTTAIVPVGPLVHHDVLGGPLKSANAAAETVAEPLVEVAGQAAATAAKPRWYNNVLDRFKRPKVVESVLKEMEAAPSRNSVMIGGAVMAAAVAGMAYAGLNAQREQDRRAQPFDAVQR